MKSNVPRNDILVVRETLDGVVLTTDGRTDAGRPNRRTSSYYIPWRCLGNAAAAIFVTVNRGEPTRTYAVTSPLPAGDVIKSTAHSAGIYEPPIDAM